MSLAIGMRNHPCGEKNHRLKIVKDIAQTSK